MNCSAVIDETSHYRYSLTRRWSKEDSVCFVMLNPSTADAIKDDPTIRRCIGFAKQWGYGALEVVNLYAFRTSHPEVLWQYPYPVGPENDAYIRRAVKRNVCVVAAWGAGAKCKARVSVVHSLLQSAFCLGRTKSGAPRHPLYVPYSFAGIPYLLNGSRVE